MNITDLFTKIEPRLGDGDKYQWHCFGGNAWMVDIGNHVSVIYDVKTQDVYQITFYDYEESEEFDKPRPAYVWTDTKSKKKYLNECKKRGFEDGDSLFYEDFVNQKSIISKVQEYQNG